MRITNQMMINNTMSNIQINKNQLNTIDNQLSTQKKISRPSEDPIVAIRALRLRASLNQVTQYLDKNIPDADSWLSITEGALDESKDIVTDLYKYCNQGSTDSYSSSERNTLGETLNKLKTSFYSQGDADYAGRYLFSGFDTDKPLTYQSDADAADVDYRITQNYDRDAISVKTVYTNAYSNDDILKLNVAYDTDGNAITPNVEDVYRVRLAYSSVNAKDLNVKLNGAEYTMPETGSVTNTDASGNEIILTNTTDANYIPKDNEMAVNSETGEILMGNDIYKTAYESNSFSVTYNKDNFIKGDLDPTRYFDCTDNNTGLFYEKKDSDIEYTINFSQELKVNTEASDAFDYNLGRDIDDLVTSVKNVIDIEGQIDKVKEMQGLSRYSDSVSQDKLATIMEGLNKQYDLAKNQMTKAFEKGIGQMQGYQQQISLAKADVGNRMARLELTESRLTEQKTSFTSLKSNNEDIDLEETVVNYSSAKLVYDASLTAASKVVQQTLLDFL